MLWSDVQIVLVYNMYICKCIVFKLYNHFQVAHNLCLAKAKKKIEQELADLLRYKSSSSTSNDDDENEQALVVKTVEEKGHAYGLLLSATKMKGCPIPEKLTRNVSFKRRTCICSCF